MRLSDCSSANELRIEGEFGLINDAVVDGINFCLIAYLTADAALHLTAAGITRPAALRRRGD